MPIFGDTDSVAFIQDIPWLCVTGSGTNGIYTVNISDIFNPVIIGNKDALGFSVECVRIHFLNF